MNILSFEVFLHGFIVHRALRSSSTKPESEKQAVEILDSFLNHCNIDVQSINKYSLITKTFCAPVLTLIWSPIDFVQCEREIRSRKMDNLITSEEYPMLRSASYDLLWISTTLMNSLKVNEYPSRTTFDFD